MRGVCSTHVIIKRYLRKGKESAFAAYRIRCSEHILPFEPIGLPILHSIVREKYREEERNTLEWVEEQ